MAFLGVLATIIVIALIIAAIALVIYVIVRLTPVYAFVWHLCTFAYWFLCNLFKWVTWPLGWLTERVKNLLHKVPAAATLQDVKRTLDLRLVRFGGLLPLGLFIYSLIFLAFAGLIFLLQGAYQTSFGVVLQNTTLGSFVGALENGFSFTPAALVSASFASFLAHLCIGKTDDVAWYIWIPYCAVFICMSSILCSFLTGAFDFFGTLGFDFIRFFFSGSGSLFLKVLGFVPMIILVYFIVISLVITIREYFCSILFGVVTLIGLIILMVILQWCKAPDGLTTLVMDAVLIGSIIAIEKIRSKVEADMVEMAANGVLPELF